MSYCRFSTDDFQCDVYVYESFDNIWVTHVANNRYIFSEELPSPVSFEEIEQWVLRHQKIMTIISCSSTTSINLPFAGESFYDLSPGDCATRLHNLKELGYRIPQNVIDSLREEENTRNENCSNNETTKNEIKN